jgi:hypothetical protein
MYCMYRGQCNAHCLQCDETFVKKQPMLSKYRPKWSLTKEILRNSAQRNYRSKFGNLKTKIYSLFRWILGDFLKTKLRPKAEKCAQTAKFRPICHTGWLSQFFLLYLFLFQGVDRLVYQVFKFSGSFFCCRMSQGIFGKICSTVFTMIWTVNILVTQLQSEVSLMFVRKHDWQLVDGWYWWWQRLAYPHIVS